MNIAEQLLAALSDSSIEIVIRRRQGEALKVEPSTDSLHDTILDFVSKSGGATGKEIREAVADKRGVDPKPIANEVAWALVELQSSTLKRSSYIDGLGPLVKTGKLYSLNTRYVKNT